MTIRSFRRPAADTVDEDEPLAPSGERLEEGSRIGSYVVESVLGSGATGTVFLVRHVVLRQVFAAKVLHGDMDPKLLQRGRNEASLTRLADHPNIVDVVTTGHLADGSVYVVMEYLVGEDLARHLWRHRRHHPQRPWLPDDRARLWMRQLLAGLGAAHAAGVIHRDLKPENVFLSVGPDGEPRLKILDFGLARGPVLDQPHKRLTTRGQVFGTPHYMAPEQGRSAADADERSDLYSVGVLLYEVVTGQVPLDGDTPMDIVLAHARTAPADPRVHRPDLPAPLAELILRCLAKDPARRFASASELARALERAWPAPAQTAEIKRSIAEHLRSWVQGSTHAVASWIDTVTEGLTPSEPARRS